MQEQPSADDAWGPCIVWLLKSIPGLLSGPQLEQPAQDSLQLCLPLSELLDACGIRYVERDNLQLLATGSLAAVARNSVLTVFWRLPSPQFGLVLQGAACCAQQVEAMDVRGHSKSRHTGECAEAEGVAGDSGVFDTLGKQVQGKLRADSNIAAGWQLISLTVASCQPPQPRGLQSDHSSTCWVLSTAASGHSPRKPTAVALCCVSIVQDLFWHIQRSNSSSTSKQPLLRAGWLAFLTIKAQLLPGFPDLVRCAGTKQRHKHQWC